MGPFPHSSRNAEISPDNPAGTNGVEFVEFAHPDPDALRGLFAKMGFVQTEAHRSKKVELWRQGDITYVLNAEPGSMGMNFADMHGPCAPSMAWRVADANLAFRHALSCGAKPYEGGGKVMHAPAIIGIGGSLIYFLDRYGDDRTMYDKEFRPSGNSIAKPGGAGFYYLDHLTHNVHRGNMDAWCRFYEDTFNFRQISFFDIEGKLTGLFSRAMTSPCGRIRIPVNESADDKSQIEEYLRRYNGEGIQHIAVGTDDIYASVGAISSRGLGFMPKPPETYYRQSVERVPGHTEPIEEMSRYGILIDGEGVLDGGETRILLQVFSKTAVGPIFFEFIQRKGDEGFGEGNFRALFESIEQDQIERGVLTAR